MSMYEQDKWQSEGETTKKIQEMKMKASKENNAVLFNIINSYERSDNDVMVLLKVIQRMNYKMRAYESFQGDIEYSSTKVRNDRVSDALETLEERLDKIRGMIL